MTGLVAGHHSYRIQCNYYDQPPWESVASVYVSHKVTLTASPTSMTLPTNSTTLTWSMTNGSDSRNLPDSCTASASPANASWTGAKARAATNSQLVTGLVAGTNNFTITCPKSGLTTSVSTVAVTVTAPIPPVPINLTATPGACGTGTINLSWTASAGATSYQLRDGATQIYTGAATSFSHTGLAVSSSHSYTVRATNATGSSAYSSAVAGTAPAICAAPSCSSATPDGDTTSATTGTRRAFANGVSADTTSVTFPTWSDVGGQDDIIWYAGINDGGGTWHADANLASHPGLGLIAVHVYLNSPGYSNVFCDAANFSRIAAPQPDLTAAPATPSSATVGTALTFSSTISNIGTAGTGASFSNFFQVATAAGGGGSITDLASSTMAALAASANAIATSPSYTFSSASTYSVRACADKTNSVSTGTITESNEGNNCGAWVNVTVSAAPVPVVTISANPTSGTVNVVNPELTWSATNTPTSCTASGDWSGAKPVSGTNVPQGVLTVMRTYVYTLTCSNIAGSGAPQSATVVVDSGGGSATIDANPMPIYSGDSTTLTWSCGTSTSGSGTNFNTGGAVSGSLVITPPSTTTYTITCSPSALTAQVTVVVKKRPFFIEE